MMMGRLFRACGPKIPHPKHPALDPKSIARCSLRDERMSANTLSKNLPCSIPCSDSLVKALQKVG